MQVQFIGCGDAFGSGGRFNTCFLLTGRSCRFLIDCGASSLVALKHFAIDPDSLDGAVVSHLHGDHFGGLPFLLLDAQLLSKRHRPFFIFAPPGIRERLSAAQEALFPGSASLAPRFPLHINEMTEGRPAQGDGFAVTPFAADHSAGAPCFSLRIDCDGKTVTYSGDTAWSENLATAARGADLFICECSTYDRPLKGHLDYATLAPKLGGIGAKRVIITHMNPEMLARRDRLAYETASDGLMLTL
jgi:ribonuclease BN (tRNA processing enzyme)